MIAAALQIIDILATARAHRPLSPAPTATMQGGDNMSMIASPAAGARFKPPLMGAAMSVIGFCASYFAPPMIHGRRPPLAHRPRVGRRYYLPRQQEESIAAFGRCALAQPGQLLRRFMQAAGKAPAYTGAQGVTITGS